MNVGIGLDVRVLAAELERVLAHQVGYAALNIVVLVGELDGTTAPTAQRSITRNDNGRKTTRTCDASVERVVRAIGELVGIAIEKSKADAVPAKSGIVHQAGIGGPNPVGTDCVRADRVCVLPRFVHDGVVFSNGEVVADQHHAIDRMLVVDAVVHFSNPVIADIGVREAAIVAGSGRRVVLDEIGGAAAGDTRYNNSCNVARSVASTTIY